MMSMCPRCKHNVMGEKISIEEQGQHSWSFWKFVCGYFNVYGKQCGFKWYSL